MRKFKSFPLVLIAVCGLSPALAQTWSKASPSKPPAAQAQPVMAYDMARKQMVLPEFPLMYFWDGKQWSSMTPKTEPVVHAGFNIAYDAARQNTVLFGYNNSGPVTWTWDGTDWTQKTSQAHPSSRMNYSMVYDAKIQRVVLFGGFSNNFVADTWLWDGTNWTQLNISGPSARAGYSLAWDPVRQQVVLFGGISGTSVLDDTWTFDGQKWSQQHPATAPPARYVGTMASDMAEGKTVLFGGLATIGKPLADFWLWDGANWQQATAGPSARAFPAMAYDADRYQVVLFGGVVFSNSGAVTTTYNDTWLWGDASGPLFATAGTPQSAALGQPFGSLLQTANVAGNSGLDPDLSSQLVDFSGPSSFVKLSASTADTDIFGHASVQATATATPGSYQVTASIPGGKPVVFSLSNVNVSLAKGPCVVTSGLDDNSPGSLRFQVAACGQGGVITFASSVQRVVLNQNASIRVIQNVTVDGGSNAVTIDGNSGSRIFFVQSGALTLKNLVLTNGLARGGDGSVGIFAGGGGAGMGGAVFVNSGNLITNHVTFSNNKAIGGRGGANAQELTGPPPPRPCGWDCVLSNSGSRALVYGTMAASNATNSLSIYGAGGGVGGDALGFITVQTTDSGTTEIGNGGGGGDLGGIGGTPAQPNGGEGGGSALKGTGGFGGGSAPYGAAGFGGGAATGSTTSSTFGGPSGSERAGGGAGLGGAIFVRSGSFLLTSTSFLNNSAIGAGSIQQDPNAGEGKGGAVFLNKGVIAAYFGGQPIFYGNTASDAGTGTACSTVVGAYATDSEDICGIWGGLGIATSGGFSQQTAVKTAFPAPVSMGLFSTYGLGPIAGVPITFSGPVNGASINPTTQTIVTDSTGRASFTAVANSVAGSYGLTATIGGADTGAVYNLTNLPGK